mgnify:CR=1 FL=1
MRTRKIKRQKETIIDYLKKLEKLRDEIDIYSPGLTKLRNDVMGSEDKYIEKVESEIHTVKMLNNEKRKQIVIKMFEIR